MRVGVFCSSRMGARPAYAEAAADLGRKLAEAGYELVYGGEEYGLMKVLADSMLGAGGRVTGVIPNIPMMMENVHPRLQEYVYVKDMAERKNVMLHLADAFAVLPGGTGTLDELSEVLCQNKVGGMDKPLALISIDGYYEPLKRYLETMVNEGMMDREDLRQIGWGSSAREALDFLETAKRAG